MIGDVSVFFGGCMALDGWGWYVGNEYQLTLVVLIVPPPKLVRAMLATLT